MIRKMPATKLKTWRSSRLQNSTALHQVVRSLTWTKNPPANFTDVSLLKETPNPRATLSCHTFPKLLDSAQTEMAIPCACKRLTWGSSDATTPKDSQNSENLYKFIWIWKSSAISGTFHFWIDGSKVKDANRSPVRCRPDNEQYPQQLLPYKLESYLCINIAQPLIIFHRSNTEAVNHQFAC